MRRLAVLATVTAMLAVFAQPVAADDTTLIEDLAGPLGLAIGDDGTIYVTEAFGPGRLIALDKHGNTNVLVAEPGTELAGLDAKGKGKVVYTQSDFGPDGAPVNGRLVRADASGSRREVASTLAYELANNPDAVNTYGLIGSTNEACLEGVAAMGFPPVYTGILESHPYAVAIDGPGYVVADAAGNTLLEVSNSGRITTLAVLPTVPQVISAEAAAGIGLPECAGETFVSEAVPTDVEVQGDNVYLSLLPGFPENPGAGQVWVINRKTGAATLIADGLVTPVDIAVGADGTIYVAELFASQISMISDGTVSAYMSLDSPGAIEIDRNGTLYATTGVFGSGSVVQLTP